MGSPTVMTRGALDCDCDEEICLLSCHVINNQNNNVDNKYLFWFYSQRQKTNYYKIVYQNEFLFQKVFFFFKHQIPQNAQYVWFLFARQIFPRYASKYFLPKSSKQDATTIYSSASNLNKQQQPWLAESYFSFWYCKTGCHQNIQLSWLYKHLKAFRARFHCTYLFCMLAWRRAKSKKTSNIFCLNLFSELNPVHSVKCHYCIHQAYQRRNTFSYSPEARILSKFTYPARL